MSTKAELEKKLADKEKELLAINKRIAAVEESLANRQELLDSIQGKQKELEKENRRLTELNANTKKNLEMSWAEILVLRKEAKSKQGSVDALMQEFRASALYTVNMRSIRAKHNHIFRLVHDAMLANRPADADLAKFLIKSQNNPRISKTLVDYVEEVRGQEFTLEERADILKDVPKGWADSQWALQPYEEGAMPAIISAILSDSEKKVTATFEHDGKAHRYEIPKKGNDDRGSSEPE